MPLFTNVDYRLVNTAEKFDAFLKDFDAAIGKVVAIDLETTGLDLTHDYIVGMSFSFKENAGYYLPLNHEIGVNLDYESTIARLKPYLESDKFRFIAHGMKFEQPVLAAADITDDYIKAHPNYATDLWLTAYGKQYAENIEGQFDKLGISIKISYDSMICAYLTGKYAKIGAGGMTWSTAALKKIATKELGIETASLEELFGIDPSKPQGRKSKKKQAERIRFETLDPEQVVEIKSLAKLITIYEYPCQDTDLTLRIFNRLYPKVKDLFLFKVDHGCVPITKLMELNGVRAHVQRMQAEYKRLMGEFERVKGVIFRDCSEALGFQVQFDVGSPEQCGDVLFTRLGYPVQERSEKTQKPLTNATVLEGMSKDYPIVHNILQARSIRKNAEDFFLAMQDYINPLDGKIHCSYATAHVSSGRYACEDPNMQNQPKLTVWKIYDKKLGEDAPVDTNGVRYFEIKSNMRANYIPPDEDFYCLEGDYSQIEYRTMAGRAQVKKWLKGYEEGVDFHVINATSIFGVTAEQVTKKMRDDAKPFSFGIGYGMRASGVQRRIGGTKDEAQVKVDRYFAGAPELLPHIQQITDDAVRNGYVTTEFGRQVWIPELRVQVVDRHTRGIRAKGEREAFNITIQGTAADILRISLNRLPVRLVKAYGIRFNDKVKPALTTHDSIMAFVHRSIHPKDAIAVLKDAMEIAIKNYPKIIAEFKVGPDYGHLIDWKDMEKFWNAENKDFGFGAYAESKGELPDVVESELDLSEENGDEVPIHEDGSVGAQLPMKSTTSVDSLITTGVSGFTPSDPAAGKDVPITEELLEETQVPQPPAKFRLVTQDGLTVTQAQQLKNLLLQHPGQNLFILVMPDNEVPMTKCMTSLNKQHEGMFKMIFPCDILPVNDNVNIGSMMKGIKV